MDIYFDEKILNNIFNNDALTDELCACIGAVVDAELEKSDSDIDFAFIDECSNMLLEIQSGDVDYDRIMPVLNSDSFIENTKKLAKGGVIRFVRVGLAAAIIFTSAITANAAVGSITGRTLIDRIADASAQKPPITAVEEVTKEYTTHKKAPSVSVTEAEEPSTEGDSVVYEAESEEDSTAFDGESTEPSSVSDSGKSDEMPKEEETATQAPIVTGLEAVIVHSVFKTDYYVGESFSAKGLYVIANYSNGSRKTVDISDCKVSGFDSSAPALCRVTISYQGALCCIEITVKEKEQETTTQTDNENE